MPPAELLAAGRSEVSGYGVEIIDDVVVRIDPGFTVHCGAGQVLAARRVVVATGFGDEFPGHPRCPRALGTGPAPLPVLPRLGGP
jgi:thioredoxin reductase